MKLNDLFTKDYNRSIETVIKADDTDHILQEVEEYVITSEISQKIGDFFEQYNNYDGANGVWISGFFGSGKSHLLKILSYVLENRSIQDTHLGQLFASKVTEDEKLKADIKAATRISSESILFNIDQQAQITSKTDADAILQVFYKVLYDHQGFYGFQPHIAEFEQWLTAEGKFAGFCEIFREVAEKDWEDARHDYVDPMIEDAVAEVCGKLFGADPDKYLDILDKFDDKTRFSIDDFAGKVKQYIDSKPSGFRLNFYVDEVGQYIAENTKLMLNLQTISESLATKCKGRSWIIVTSQEDLGSLVGDDRATQSDDFSKIQGRFKIRIPLTSANVDEVIEKRLLSKNEKGVDHLSSLYKKEKENLATLLSFSDVGVQFRQSYADADEFIAKYPFVTYQFDLFQQSIKSLSRHNAFQGKHASVGERSMLGVFQEVLKQLEGFSDRNLVSFDQLFEGLRSTMRTEVQNSVILAERNLSDKPMAVRILKALFMVKYFDSFKATIRNISVLLLRDLEAKPNVHQQNIEAALNLLEQQNYVQRQGDVYEFLTDVEKDIQEDIKSTDVDPGQVTALFSELLFDGIIKDSRIQFAENKQYYDFTKKVDGVQSGRERELTIELVTPHFERYEDQNYYQGLSMGNLTHMLLKLSPHDRVSREARLYLKTAKYIKQNQSTTNNEAVKRILFDQGQLNQERKRELLVILNDMLAMATVYLNGSEHQVSSTGDGRTKVVYAFQDLVRFAYSKLKLLGETTFDEVRLKNIMKDQHDDLFGTNEDSATIPENEVLLFIQRREKQNERTSLSFLKDHFSKKPYGWSEFAVWCIAGMLYKRGKIEAKADSDVLDDTAFLDALLNNRLHGNTLLKPQVEFGEQQIRTLKNVHKDLFNVSNPHNEPRDAADAFKERAAEELEYVQSLIAQVQNYPFVAGLKDLAVHLDKLRKMDYASLITSIGGLQDEILDMKEDHLDPIRQFMNGGQKAIYDRLRTFESYNQANFSYVDAPEKDTITNAKDDDKPYLGNTMQEAKSAMDTLEKRVKETIQQEKKKTVEKIDETLSNLTAKPEFDTITNEQQHKVTAPLEQLKYQAKNERFVGNLKDIQSKLGDVYTRQLNAMITLATPEEKQETRRQFIKQSQMKLSFSRKELENEEDVNEYLEELRQSMLKHIRNNRNIILD